MTGKTHQSIGLTTGLLVFLAMAPSKYNPATLAAVLIISHLAALLPDIDQPASVIWRKFPFGRVAGELTDPLLEHRNLTHSFLGALLVAWGLHSLYATFPTYWGIDVHILLITSISAYFSHLIADMFTIEGIPLLFPIKRSFGFPPKPFDGIRIETGQWFENLIIFPFFNLLFWVVIYYKWSLVKLIIFK